MGKVSEILESLMPRDQEELSLLRGLLEFAQSLQARAQRDLGFAHIAVLAGEASRMVGDAASDFPRWLAGLPEDSKRYFYSLVDAIEIYRHIHGEWIAVPQLKLEDTSVSELRQIRDMCLDEAPRVAF